MIQQLLIAVFGVDVWIPATIILVTLFIMIFFVKWITEMVNYFLD